MQVFKVKMVLRGTVEGKHAGKLIGGIFLED
jgi:hypothetical protein